MKKLLCVFMVLFSFAVIVNAADAVAAGVTVTNSRYQPSNISWVWMNTDVAVVAAADSFAADLNKRLYGPYEIVRKPSDKKKSGVFPAGFQIYSDPPLGTDDTLIGSYQLLPSVNGVVPTFADTVTTGWVTACTTSDAGGVNKYIDLSSNAGSFIVWRWMSRSATAVGLYGNAGLGFKESAAYLIDLR